MADNNKVLLPVFPNARSVALPSLKMSISVVNEYGKRLFDSLKEGDYFFFVRSFNDDAFVDVENIKLPATKKTGTICKLISIVKNDVSYTVEFIGDDTADLVDIEIDKDNKIVRAELAPHDNAPREAYEIYARLGKLQAKYDALKSKYPTLPELPDLTDVAPENIPYQLAAFFNSSFDVRQLMIEYTDVIDKMKLCLNEIEKLDIDGKIEFELDRAVSTAMDKNQREYVLREKMKAVKGMLKEFDGDDQDAVYEKALNENKDLYPENIQQKIKVEMNRLKTMPAASQEASVVRTYLDLLVEMPWRVSSQDNEDLNNVQKILDEDHYGLVKQKERILEYLAVKAMTKSLKAPILCLYGPPGVGKTSLGVSIARALGRKFVKVSLGGVSDESEIRGHRRTYVGALPGKIVQGIRNAGVNNPLFLLDEIDKLEGGGYHGDPASAMLEVLDPEQNVAFQDNYLEETFDLSNVLFICTANDLSKIPEPLRDRLELIELNTYTKFEKMHIAKEHLINLELKENGIKPEMIEFEDDALDYIIEDYTREAGVRDLRRRIGKIMRKFAVKYLKDNTFNHLVVTRDVVTDYLGKPPFIHTKNLSESQVGVVNGLAYTSYGGEILPIEVNLYPGKGTLIKTGSLGDVMKESMEIAFTYVKSIAQKYGAPADFFETHDFHIHAPEGATPKDGPSAGVAISTAILSAVINKPLRNDVGMTGEVDLRGNSMTIGGLREKSLAAVREHLKLILVPKGNHNDVVDLPEEVKNNLEIIEVSSVEDVIKYAFVEAPQPVEAK
ncbi:MAG TPA: endopeptidase La [Firmicutes bacterium]|jgi:endopeptidase La|nr:endopeptidase La [Bacillota bacterium]HAX00451.1 endopeptidase La [Bacillota bacterium]